MAKKGLIPDKLRNMEVGAIENFPLEKSASISTTMYRLKKQMWQEKPKWEIVEEDFENGIVQIKRIS